MAMAETKVKKGDLFLLLAKENWHEKVCPVLLLRKLSKHLLCQH